MLAVTNLANRRRTVDLGAQPGAEGDPVEVFADRPYDPVGSDLTGIEVAGYGYRWIRLRSGR
jgi:maltose alpha-D-glucosyltransferase/alpha-amylase